MWDEKGNIDELKPPLVIKPIFGCEVYFTPDETLARDHKPGYTAVIDRRVAGFDCRRRDRVTGNGRCGIAGAYGNAVAGRQGLGVYTIKTGEFRGQLNVKTVAGFVVYNTDVAFRQAGGISAAFEVQGVVFTEFNFLHQNH